MSDTEDGREGGGSRLGNWSSLIGIVTAIVATCAESVLLGMYLHKAHLRVRLIPRSRSPLPPFALGNTTGPAR